jgi:hypothetical protein
MRKLPLALTLILCLDPFSRAADITTNIDWPTFLSRHDLVWTKTPTTWEQSAFLGNGLLGITIYSPDDKTLTFNIGRSDVVLGIERIPVGELHLEPVGKIESMTMRQNLWDAEATGVLKTSRGEIKFLALSHASALVNIIQIEPTEGESTCTFAWKPGLALSPRKIAHKEPITDEDKNPDPVLSNGGRTSLQRLKDGEHCTAWSESSSGAKRTVYLTVGYSRQKDKAFPEAKQNLQSALDAGFDQLLTSHRTWWHNFYPHAFVSIPDTRLESFYWIQIYKLASATRADRPAIDLNGPWFRQTPWPKIWWNLNIQLTYWPVYTGNRLELGESLCRTIDRGSANLADNAREFSDDSIAIGRTSSYDCAGKVGEEVCNLPWALHNYYLQCRYSMDEPMLRDRLYPLLKRSINYYLHFTKPGPDGKLHITTGYSPEYPEQPKPNPDCNIDLSLLRWGCETLLKTAEHFKIADPQIPQWKETLADLTPYPTDARGLKISASVSFDKPHRHYSHMLMVYPLYLMDPEQPDNLPLINKSLDNWLGMPSALRGYSYTGAASMYAMLGRGDESIKYLNQLLDNKMHSGKVHPNTQYTEAGPVIETPLSAAASLHDMLLTSWGDKIRVFPGVPAAWRDVSFQNLRTEGAFLVSAVRKNGKTQFIKIESLAGAPCRLATDLKDPVASENIPLKPLPNNVLEIPLTKGQSIILRSADSPPDLTLTPVAPQQDHLNAYGIH